MNDYEYLIHLLYCAVHDTPPQEKPEGVSFENVFRMAKAHEVVPMAYLSVERLQNKPEAAAYHEWQVQICFAVQRDVRQSQARDAIISLLHENGIRTLEAQGTVTKLLYPSPELRMMSDIDFIIDPANQDKTKALMTEQGYEVYQQVPEEFNVILDDGLLVEFHNSYFTELIYDRKAPFADAVSDPFLHAVSKAGDPLSFVPEDTYYYLYSVLHTIKHFETVGCGIRRIMDLYYLKKAYAGKINQAFVDKAIDDNGFRRSCDTLFALEKLWFEKVPATMDLTEAIDMVINGGNHGTKEVFARNSIRKDREELAKDTRFQRIFAFLFPSKQYMYINYPQCKERGWSWLACWCYRVVHKLKHARLSYAWQYIKTIIHS